MVRVNHQGQRQFRLKGFSRIQFKLKMEFAVQVWTVQFIYINLLFSSSYGFIFVINIKEKNMFAKQTEVLSLLDVTEQKL